MSIYTGMLDVVTRNKNLKVPEWKLTESCIIAVKRLYAVGSNML
jgi:hypothetical protein